MERETPPKLEITRSLNLNPEDWLRATWRPRNPLPRPEVKPFDKIKALKKLAKVWENINLDNSKARYIFEAWKKADIPHTMSRQEANFWLTAITTNERPTNIDLCESDVTLQDARRRVIEWCGKGLGIPPEIMIPIASLFSVIEFIVALFEIKPLEDWEKKLVSAGVTLRDRGTDLASRGIIEGFRIYILPYLTDAEIQEMRQYLRPFLDTQQHKYWLNLYDIAAMLGMHEELLTLQETWKNGGYKAYQYCIQAYSNHVFGFKSAQAVESWMRENKFLLCSSTDVRAWLAHTEYSALDFIRDSILLSNNKKIGAELLEAFTLVEAPEAAPYMLELILASKTPKIAQQWLNDRPNHAIFGLISMLCHKNYSPANVSQKQLSDAAITFLQSMVKKGHQSLIEAVLEQETGANTTRLREILLPATSGVIYLDAESTPTWCQTALVKSSDLKHIQLPKWAISHNLPSITTGNKCLNTEQIEICLRSLKESTLNSPHPLVAALKNNCNSASLDAFVWRLFEVWLEQGGPAKEKWAMAALGLLGSDAIALKLAPLIRKMPGENYHQRAVFGLECLRAIGSDTAIMVIHSIAEKVKFRGLKDEANKCIQAIAKERKLTAKQLEDRIIPDCGLDERGTKVFDFGSRQFYFVLGAGLKPMVRDADGRRRANLPEPGKQDDPEKAQQAITDWKLLKKLLTQVVKTQATRLELAMCNERRWKTCEFQKLLVEHPLMTHLVQQLVWGCYDRSVPLVTTFRVAEDRTFTDCKDNTVILNDMASVGVVHPCDLDEETRAAWRQILSDYEIIPAFSQINREIYTLKPEETDKYALTRFNDINLTYLADKPGWVRSYEGVDNGYLCWYSRQFPAANIGVRIGGDIDGCCFYPIHTSDLPVNDKFSDRINSLGAVRLGDVSPIVVSEVIRDLSSLSFDKQ